MTERVHDLKTWPGPFAAVRAGLKPWELRQNDRDYQVGDVLRLMEYLPAEERYTGEVEQRKVIWKLDGGSFGLPDDYVILSLDQTSHPMTEQSTATEGLAAWCWDLLLDKDDRTSPPEYPDMLLITREELEFAMQHAFDLANRRSDDPALVGEVERLREENERLNDRNVEVSMLAGKWMEAHDKAVAGEPYSYPNPADVPKCVAALQASEARNQKLVEALEKAVPILERQVSNERYCERQAIARGEFDAPDERAKSWTEDALDLATHALLNNGGEK